MADDLRMRDGELYLVPREVLDMFGEELLECRQGNATEHRMKKFWRRMRDRGTAVPLNDVRGGDVVGRDI